MKFASFTVKSAVALGLLAALLSFAKFQHCRETNWAQPDEYVHACYSDLSALFDSRGLSTHTWPFSSVTNSVEYPPGTAMVMWATSFLVGDSDNSIRNYFDINALFIALLFLATVVLIAKMKPKLWFLLPLSPAVVASLYINWDLWAVISAVAAIYFFDQRRYIPSALLLGLSIATKFFPIVLLVPILIIFIRRFAISALLKYFAITLSTWAVINIPFAVTTPQGWYRFFELNAARPADWGSLWIGIHIFGVKLSNVSTNSFILFAIGALAYAIYLLRIERIPSLAQCAFVIVAIFTAASKVYSPQYILWLTPLAILALQNARDRTAYWIWQGSELIYHFAIWQYLALFTGSRFGLSSHWYAASIFVRLGALAWFCASLMRKSTPPGVPQQPQFPTTAVSG
ncbi:unannotated protein [freshwater metagenome]|uniref:Unannotated protein n=1 Tax=freshwater metagenome TaxID=449393 RepID=A0A6J7L5G0_9ZZZZ